jgi:hypothetical protein
MSSEIINGNILVFKISEKGEMSNINITDDVVNFIADMRDVNVEVIEVIKNNLLNFGQSIYDKKGSFVLVTTCNFNEELNIVPTIQEAFDFIEMEEIERQLEF